MSFGDDTLEPPTLICQGTKFIVARWMFDANLQTMREDPGDFSDEDFVTGADIAVLRNYDELNKLAEFIKDDVKEFYDDSDEPNLDVIVWSWHTLPDAQGKPERMILYRGDEEMCTVVIEQVAPVEHYREEHS